MSNAISTYLKRIVLVTTSFVLALGLTTAAVPFLAAETASAVGAPAITHVGPALINAMKEGAPYYSGITVTLRTQNITTAESVTVTVNRAAGGPVVKTARISVINAMNTSGANASNIYGVSAPIIVNNFSYDETGSSSWNPPVNPIWNSTTIPESVTVNIKGDGLNLTETSDVTGPALYQGMIPADTTVPVISLTSPSVATFNSAIPLVLKATDNVGLMQIDANVYKVGQASSVIAASVRAATVDGVDEYLHTINVSSLIDGDYYVKFNATDLAGNKTSTTVFNFTIDNTIPTFTLTDDGSPRVAIADGSKINPTVLGDKDNNGNTIRFSKESTTDTLYVNGSPLFGNGYVGGTSGQIGAAFKSDGVYTVYTKDIAGNQSASLTFTVDTTFAAFEIVTPTNSSTVKGDQRVTAKITDANDITKVLINVGDGQGNYVWEAGKTNNKVTRDGDLFYIDIDTSMLPDGINYIVLRATDGANNTKYWNNNANTRQHSYVVDNTTPILYVKQGANLVLPSTLTNSLFNTISFKLFDVYNIDKVEINGTTKDLTNNTWSDINGVTTGVFGAVEGPNKITVYDLAGNIATYSFTIDTIAPTVPEVETPAGEQYFNTGNILNKWSISDDENGIRGYQIAYQYDDGHTFSGANTCASETLTIGDSDGFIACRDVDRNSRNHGPSTGEQGGVTIWVRAIDNAGNYSDWSSSVHYYYDATPPTATVGVNSTINPTVATVTINDAVSTQGSYVINVYNAADMSKNYRVCGLTNFLVGQTSATCSILSGLPDGEYYLKANVLDGAGNNSASIMNGGGAYSEHFTIDNTNPSVSASLSDVLIGLSDPNPTLTVNASDLGSDIDYTQYKVMDSTSATVLGWFDITGNTAIVDISSLSDGTYTLRARTFDNAGNKKSGADVVFIIDRMAPSVTVNTPASINSGDSLTLTGAITDGPVSAVQVILNGNTYDADVDGNDWTLTLNGTQTGLLTVGEYSVSVVAIDEAGNVSDSADTDANTILAVLAPDTSDAGTPDAQPFANPANTPTPPTGQNFTPAGNAATDDLGEEDVQGAQTDKNENQLKNPAVLAGATGDGWNILGLMWYWWLLIIAAVGAAWWMIAAARRRGNES